MTMQKIEAQSPEAQSANIVADNIAKLRAMFPDLVTETNGVAAINVDVLKALVGDASVTDADVTRSLSKDSLGATDFLTLLSPRAGDYLEAIAQGAQQLTVQHFGRTIQMFIPLYLSNHCKNRCTYCGFNVTNEIPRRVLSLAEIEREAEAIARTGMQHVLILTGEDRRATPLEYLCDAVAVLKRYFASVSIEIYPLHTEEYAQLKAAGVDGMTVFQETYDPAVYKSVHLGGKKRDFAWRLDAPARAAEAGLRTVNIGPLLGLADIGCPGLLSLRNVTAFLTRDCLHAGSDVSQRQLRRRLQVGEPSEGVSRRKKSSDSAKINSASLSSVATW